MGWLKHWYIGDISNAFLQAAPLVGKPALYMRQPKQGLRGLVEGQNLKLLNPCAVDLMPLELGMMSYPGPR